MEYTYLLINFFTIIIPFLFSFHPKLQFHKTWKAFFPAVILTGIFFIAWDIHFTEIGVWGFNEEYLIGIEVFNLPIEEVLFFFCIPYACVFTFHCLDQFIGKKFKPTTGKAITLFLIICLTALSILNVEHVYTFSTFTGLAVLLAIAGFYLKVTWLLKFYLIYSLLLIPFFVVNGLLTGAGLNSPVVWYNESEFMGIRLWTIPIEDIFYGMGLILMNLLIYKRILSWFGKRKASEKTALA